MDDDVPGILETYGYAWGVLWARFPELLIAALVWIALALPGGLLHHARLSIGATLYDTLVMVPLNFGALYVYLRAVRGEEIRVRHLFEAFRSAYLRTLGVHVLFVVLVGSGLVLLVIPGIWIAARLSFVAFLVLDEHAELAEAIGESWRRTRGLAGRIVGLWLLGVPIAIAGLLLAGVGIVPAALWIHLAFAAFFFGVTTGVREPAAAHLETFAGA